MGEVSVAEAARRLRVNVQRVHQRIADGSLPARRIGHQYVIDEADLARVDQNPTGRPPSERSVWDLLDLARAVAPQPAEDPAGAQPDAEHRLEEMSASARSRALGRLRDLIAQRALVQPSARAVPQEDLEADANAVARHLRSLLRNRARRRPFRAAVTDLADLRSDQRIHLSGVSSAHSGIASADVVEGYVSHADLQRLVDDFLLIPDGHDKANVVLHVATPARAADLPWASEHWLVTAADLAEHYRPRETARAAQIVHEVARRHPHLARAGSR